jgi:UDP-sugar transporter A1/2/3
MIPRKGGVASGSSAANVSSNTGSGSSELSAGFAHPGTRKYASLAFFVVMNSVLIIALRFAAVHSNPKDEVISSTEVLFSEMLKFIFSVICCFVIDANCSFHAFVNNLKKGIIEDEQQNDLLKLSIPAVLYTVQNNLQYVIESGTFFLVLYQFKIISTAIFYSTMLSRRISPREWMLILALAIGVGMAESSQSDIQYAHHASNIAGIISVTIAILTSGFAGVFFEKIMKDSKSSIWLINLQMSILGVIFGMVSSFLPDNSRATSD